MTPVRKAVIRVRDVSKGFSRHMRHDERLVHAVSSLLRSLGGLRSQTADRLLWALKGVSFDVHEGETLGIMGPNGAGKTTLLRLIAEVLKPTKGVVELRGKTCAVLHASAGFHRELTGRENLYFKGALHGIKSAEIRRQLDEIVAFSELEAFLDTPIRHYSSGMVLRLGFSLAVHIDSDILLLDETLAVGDLGFRRKCLAKFHELAVSGKTTILVSHDIETIRSHCSRALLLSNGELLLDGPAHDTATAYEGRFGMDVSQRAVR